MFPPVITRTAFLAARGASIANLRNGASIYSVRYYARNDKPHRAPPKPRPIPSDAPPYPVNPPGTLSTSEQVRKQQEGRAQPKDQTWKPEAGIKFDSSSKTAEFDKGATPDRNTEPQPPPGPGATRARPKDQRTDGTDFYPSQINLQGPASSQNETGAHSPSPSSTSSNDAPSKDPLTQEPETTDEATQRNAPLPDLRQGIPSTFDAEYLRSPSSARSDEAEFTGLNITEDPSARSVSGRGGGGKDGSDLPRSAYVSSNERKRERIAFWGYLLMFTVIGGNVLYLGRNWENEEERRAHPDAANGWGISPIYERIKARLSGQMGYYTEPTFPKLLPDMDASLKPPLTLVVSLEDMLVHSEWTREHGWRLAKRPGMDYFLRYLSQYYELVIWTTAPMSMADPVIRKLDPYRIVMWPLFREATRYRGGEYIKVGDFRRDSVVSTRMLTIDLGSLVLKSRHIENGHH